MRILHTNLTASIVTIIMNTYDYVGSVSPKHELQHEFSISLVPLFRDSGSNEWIVVP